MDDRGQGDAGEAAGSRDLVAGGGPTLAARLDAWLAEARVEGFAEARARERWLAMAAAADATFAGVLLDLAERGAGASLATTGGRRLQGVIEVLGADFLSVRTASGGEVLLATEAVTSVRTAPAVAPASGERVVTTELRLGEVLAALAAERARVRLIPRDGAEAVSGELRSVGTDLVAVRTDGEQAAMAYLRLAAVAEVALG